MVAHHPQVPLRHVDGEADLRGRVAGVEVGLVERLPVDREAAFPIAADHGVAADPDDPLDQVLLPRGGQQPDEGECLLELLDDDRGGRRCRLAGEPAPGILEDDHVTAVRLGPEPRGELVDQHPVADPDGLLHGARGDHERLDQERLQHQGDGQGQQRQQRHLPGERGPAAAPDLPGQPAALGPGGGGGPRGRFPRPARPAPVTHGRRPAARGRPRRRLGGATGSSGRPARRSTPRGR